MNDKDKPDNGQPRKLTDEERAALKARNRAKRGSVKKSETFGGKLIDKLADRLSADLKNEPVDEDDEDAADFLDGRPTYKHPEDMTMHGSRKGSDPDYPNIVDHRELFGDGVLPMASLMRRAKAKAPEFAAPSALDTEPDENGNSVMSYTPLFFRRTSQHLGRVGYLSEDVVKGICSALIVGLTVEQACHRVGILPSTYQQWIETARACSDLDPNKLTLHQENCIMMVQAINATIADSVYMNMSAVAVRSPSWQANAWILERRHGFTNKEKPEPPPEPVKPNMDFRNMTEDQIAQYIELTERFMSEDAKTTATLDGVGVDIVETSKHEVDSGSVIDVENDDE